VNTAAPSISGTPTQGQTLTLTTGTWTGATSTSDQWMYCTSADNTTCTTPITGATGTTYPLAAADVGHYIGVVETATDTDTTTTPSTAATSTSNSNVLGPVAALPAPVNQAPPQISGTYTVGQVLAEGGDTWSNSPTSFTYQWWRCTSGVCSKMITNGGMAQTYTTKAVDVGHTLEVEVTATNAGGPSPPAMSAQTPVIATATPVPVNQGAPTISGTLQVGQTLTEGAASWTNSPTSTAVQWRRCDSNSANCQNIAGATAKTYTLTSDDLGAMIQVAESATNAGGTTTAYSGFSGPVTDDGIVPPPSPNPGSTPSVSGAPEFGQTLTASGAQFSGNPGGFSYQWLRCTALGCSAIPGATGATYTPTSSDVGDSIAFAETATNSGGTSATVQSGRTGTVTAPSTTALQTNASSPVAGQTVTLVATVTSAAGSVKPAGTVGFRSGGAAIPGCTGLALGSATPTAVCQASFPASTANVTAAYSATPGTFITGSTSSPTTLTISRAATTVTVASSAHATLGAKTTYTATVHPPAGSSLTPTGRVTFTDDGKSIKGCGSEALAAHKAPCSVKYVGIKQHRIAARYSGDANFAPSASITSHVLVQPQAPRGFVAVYMNWTFGYTLHSTRITSLTASGLSTGIRVSVTCSGGGCPFAHRTLTAPASGKCGKGKGVRSGCLAARSVNLTPIFGKAHLQVGTKVTLAITHRNWVGKYYRFTIRPSHLPTILVSCLAVNGTRPGVGCSAP
jgi:Bacterial Ig-like domain (group 3)